MLKTAYFLEKTVKKLPQRQTNYPVCFRRLWAPPLDTRVVTLAYYYKFFEFISSAKCVLLPQKRTI